MRSALDIVQHVIESMSADDSVSLSYRSPDQVAMRLKPGFKSVLLTRHGSFYTFDYKQKGVQVTDHVTAKQADLLLRMTLDAHLYPTEQETAWPTLSAAR